jgi:hypothetical protein
MGTKVYCNKKLKKTHSKPSRHSEKAEEIFATWRFCLSDTVYHQNILSIHFISAPCIRPLNIVTISE